MMGTPEQWLGHLMESLVFCCEVVSKRLFPSNKTKLQRSEVLVGLLRVTTKRIHRTRQAHASHMARDTSVVEGGVRIRTARALSLVCLVISRSLWFGEAEHGRQKCAGAGKQGPSINVVFSSIPGPDTIPFLVRCYGVWQSRPKITFQWCTPKFDMTTIKPILGDVHDLRSRQVCPTRSGARCLRLRQWSMPYLRTAVRARHEVDGPEFVEMFERISVLQVDDHLQASCAERDATVQEVAWWRPFGHHVARSSAAGANKGTSLRLEGHRRVALAGRLRCGTGLAANIGHNPDVWPWLRCRVQASLRDSEIALVRNDKLSV